MSSTTPARSTPLRTAPLRSATLPKTPLLNALLVLAAFLAGLWVNGAQPTESIAASPQAALQNSWQLFLPIGPVLGFIAAQEMSRFRGILNQLGRPSFTFKVWARSIAPAQVMAFIFVSAHLLFALANPAAPSPSLNLALPGLAIIALHSLAWPALGATLGLYLPTIVALPTAAFLPFVLLAYPLALSAPVWRFMFGQTGGLCCGVDQVIDPIFYPSSFLMLGAVVLGMATLVAAAHSPQTVKRVALLTGLGILGLGGFSSFAQASQGSHALAVERPREQLQCTDGECVWPETPPAVLAANRQALDQLGAPTAFLWDATPPPPVDGTHSASGGAANYRLIHSTNPQVLVPALISQHLQADAQLQRTPSCWAGDGGTLSVADALDAVPEGELARIALDESGRLKENTDHEAITRLVNNTCEVP